MSLNPRELDPKRVLSSKAAMFEAEGRVRDLAVSGNTNVHNIAVDLLNTKVRLFSR